MGELQIRFADPTTPGFEPYEVLPQKSIDEAQAAASQRVRDVVQADIAQAQRELDGARRIYMNAPTESNLSLVTNAEAVLRLRQSDVYLQQIAAERFREFAKEELQSELEEYLNYRAKLQNGALDYYAVAVGYDHVGLISDFHQNVFSFAVKGAEGRFKFNDVGSDPREEPESSTFTGGPYLRVWVAAEPYYQNESDSWIPLSGDNTFEILPPSLLGNSLGYYIRIQSISEEFGGPSVELGAGFDPIHTVAGMFRGMAGPFEAALIPLQPVAGAGEGLLIGFITGLEGYVDLGINFKQVGMRAGFYPTARTIHYNDDLLSQLNPGVRVELDY